MEKTVDSTSDEKQPYVLDRVDVTSDEEKDVFSDNAEVQYRTLHWIQAAIVFLKCEFAIGVLSVPASLNTLGAVGGTLVVFAFGSICTYLAYTMGQFKANHSSVHSLADAAHLMGGPIAREIVGIIYLLSWVMCVGISVLTASIAFNAITGGHTICTVAWTAISSVIVAAASSVPTFKHVSIISWVGFVSALTAVFIVTVAVTRLDRPAAAPQTGPYDLGFNAIAHPTFTAGITACASIFISYAGTPSFVPIIAEMKKPKDYNKAVSASMGFVIASYITFGLVIYAYAGQWLASPALGSAGPLIKKISYGIALPGIFAGAIVYQHSASKYLMVRLLRGTKHLQSNTKTHWVTWLGVTWGLTLIAFVIAEGIPFFGYLLGLVGSIFFAPLAVVIPTIMWAYDNDALRKGNLKGKLIWGAHLILFLFGAFMTVAGSYGSIVSIVDAFATGTAGTAFSCADNSGTYQG